MKRLCACILIMALFVAIVPLAAAHERIYSEDEQPVTFAYPVEGGNIYFEEATGRVLYADETVTAAVIPSEINGVAVKSIGAFAFRDCELLKSVEIADSVELIEDHAFIGCKALQKAVLGNGVKTIAAHSFWNCIALTELTFGSALETIEPESFYDCISLKTVTLPASLTNLGFGAFTFCTSITEFIVEVGNTMYSTDESGVLFDIEKSVLIQCPGALEGDYKIADTVTLIASQSFLGCANLKTLTIPESVTEIGWLALNECESLTDVYYEGSKEEFASIVIGEGNVSLRNATIHFLQEDECSHTQTEILNYKKPTCEEDGYSGDLYCKDCEKVIQTGEVILALGHQFEDGVCSVCGKSERPFDDVPESAFYHEAVLWAVENSITTGVSENKFAPNDSCTRGQIVTFLWRANGSPEPKTSENPFADVKESAFYYKAVLWAVEKGITSGTSANTFEPDAVCTRAQVATFLWRSQGEPKPAKAENPFSDISEESYYYTAVLWAVENEITQGVGVGKFAPNDSCTRGQIVTFLYRAETAEVVEESPYAAVVRAAIERSNGYEAEGFLYDIDGNGVEELILMFSMIDGAPGEAIPYMNYSVYTMDGEEAIALIEDEILYAQAGGAQGLVGAVKIDGKTYFAAWQQGGDVDYIYGSWKIYTVDGKQIDLTTKVSYKIENGNGSATINDEAVDFATYEAWVDALEELLTIDGYGYNLEELLPTV